MQILTIIALEQPIPLLNLVSQRGVNAFEHVYFLEHRGFVRTQGNRDTPTIITTDQFADTFGLSRNVKKMQAELRKNSDILL